MTLTRVRRMESIGFMNMLSRNNCIRFCKKQQTSLLVLFVRDENSHTKPALQCIIIFNKKCRKSFTTRLLSSTISHISITTMAKNYSVWHEVKHVVNNSAFTAYYKEREIWFCSIGLNVGTEQDGKHSHFERPVLIFKKFNKFMFWGIPLTTAYKHGPPFFDLSHNGFASFAILSQMRLFDSKRLQRKVRKISALAFKNLKESLVGLIYNNDPPPAKPEGVSDPPRRT